MVRRVQRPAAFHAARHKYSALKRDKEMAEQELQPVSESCEIHFKMLCVASQLDSEFPGPKHFIKRKRSPKECLI